MQETRPTAGFTLLEMMIVVGIIGAVTALAVGMMGDSFGDARAKGSVRSLADLMMLARSEAIRTRDNHIVFIGADAQDQVLTGPGGVPAAALLIRDLDADGEVDNGEKIASVALDTTGSLRWGSAWAAVGNDQAPNDNPGATFPETDLDFVCCTFLEPDADPSRWVVFLPDGLPRAFSISPFTIGQVASGNGAVYVTSDSRDYGVVLAPLGGVRVHAWNRGAGAWTQ